MTRWIIDGFSDVGLYRISESVRAYAYLILSSQASARSSIVRNTASALTAQSAFLNNFENVVNCRVNIQEDIKHYQDTLSYTSSKVDYSMGENIYMLSSDMNLKIRLGTVGYSNKIPVFDGKVSLGKNEKVNSLVLEPVISTPKMKIHKYSKTNSLGLAHSPDNISHKKTGTHSQRGKNCSGTGSGKWFCNMEYISMKVSHHFNKKVFLRRHFLYGSPAEINKLHS